MFLIKTTFTYYSEFTPGHIRFTAPSSVYRPSLPIRPFSHRTAGGLQISQGLRHAPNPPKVQHKTYSSSIGRLNG
jgi:hypothetical protein